MEQSKIIDTLETYQDQSPSLRILNRLQRDNYSEALNFHELTLKHRGVPNDQNSTRCTHRWKKSKLIKTSRVEGPNHPNVKLLTLSFLQTNYGAVTLLNLGSNITLASFRIQITHIPTQHIPITKRCSLHK